LLGLPFHPEEEVDIYLQKVTSKKTELFTTTIAVNNLKF
jgi:hypothetical protein